MDIVLATSTENPSLALKNIERYEDDSGFGCLLSVRSNWLAVDYPLSFEVHPMSQFIAALGDLDRTLKGEAILKPMWEEQYIRLAGDGSGYIIVSGELVDHSENEQHVRFRFSTDQGCLSRFIADLKDAAQPETGE